MAILFIILAATMITVAFYNPWLLLAVALGVANGFFNTHVRKKDIESFKDRINDLWHGLQFFILCTILLVLWFSGVVMTDELLISTAFYYAAFEVSMNYFSGKDLNYVGIDAKIDAFMWKIFVGFGFDLNRPNQVQEERMIKREGMVRTLFMVTKLFMLLGGIGWFLANK
jgi:hypothetical protein